SEPLCELRRLVVGAKLQAFGTLRIPQIVVPQIAVEALRPVISIGAEVMDQIFQPKQRHGAPAEAAG
ncbi:MAG: hypothetical protein ACRDOD_06180, partial [Streptosporangiaceae bacterium]